MEIDKKIIKKLIEALEDLKKSLNNNDIISSDKSVEEKIEVSKAKYAHFKYHS